MPAIIPSTVALAPRVLAYRTIGLFSTTWYENALNVENKYAWCKPAGKESSEGASGTLISVSAITYCSLTAILSKTTRATQSCDLRITTYLPPAPLRICFCVVTEAVECELEGEWIGHYPGHFD